MNISSKMIQFNIFKRSCSNAFKCFSTTPHQLVAIRLTAVGRIEDPKETGPYKTGQMFMHRVFGYRGVILFPYTSKVYDRDLSNRQVKPPPLDTISYESPPPAGQSLDDAPTPPSSNASQTPPDTTSTSDAASDDYLGQISRETKDNIKGAEHTYYQVLIDSRDCTYLKTTKKAQTEAVTFLGNQDNGRTLYAVPGLDYVSHEDVLPFTANDVRPNKQVKHELFHKFLRPVDMSSKSSDPFEPPFESSVTLKAWRDRNHPWLDQSDVHKEITENVRVTVIPFYMGCREAHNSQSQDVYWWRYSIRLENLGEQAVQLRERHWRIFSLSGTLETVRGRGVVGAEPFLTGSDPAFQYSSHVSLQSPSGHMWGTYRMAREDGHKFEIRIPPFALESKQTNVSL